MNSYQIITDMDRILVQTGNMQKEAFGRACWICELALEHMEERMISFKVMALGSSKASMEFKHRQEEQKNRSTEPH